MPRCSRFILLANNSSVSRPAMNLIAATPQRTSDGILTKTEEKSTSPPAQACHSFNLAADLAAHG
ncbi:auxin response factor 18 [Pyrus ussuriensis x Pyrus communis]|uniref:Auxin response factor 18 n=1 Tax=Pyrus ussuriensis x Pyrus communis TaxID=2448454 RepID=A0A5N5H654_9ROSA|nr:auxin response factor 18 [Pyrus ussuriensis x Pyrus communis]